MSRRILKIVGVVTGVVLLLLSFVFPVKQQAGWMDSVTGASKHSTQWIFGLECAPTIEPSALSKWLVREEGAVQYDWRYVQGNPETIWGMPVGCALGRAPPIYPLHGDLGEHFVRASSDEELRRFIKIMREGSDVERQAAVDAAERVALQAIDGVAACDGE